MDMASRGGDMKLWQFEPLDSCFFRGAMPFNAGEGGYLDSMFPPTMQTLSGAFRYVVAVPLEGNRAELEAVVGKAGDDPSPLSFSGPYVFKDENRLYPVPLHLLCSENDSEWTRLAPPDKEKYFQTDICDGEVLLPVPGKELKGAKPPEDAWLDQHNMDKVLLGGTPASYLKRSDLFKDENRVGIGRDNQTRTTVEGLLYFTKHLRLEDDVTIGLGVDGLKEENAPKDGTLVRLGGEGRVARLGRINSGSEQLPARPNPEGGEKRLILTLLTHGDFGGNWFPKELTEGEADKKAIWKGSIKGRNSTSIHVEIVSACLGKAVREGGWDYKVHAPKPLKSLVPAGSSYFVKVADDLETAIEALHGAKIGNRTKFGYGEIAVGLWK